MKPALPWPFGVLVAWIVTFAPCPLVASAAECPIAPRTSAGLPSAELPDSSGYEISAWVSAEGYYRTIERGRVWRMGSDSLEFARGYSRVFRGQGESGWRADTTWRASLEEISFLMRGTKNRAVSAAKLDHGARICGYVTREGRYRAAEGAAVYRLAGGDLELVWKADAGSLGAPSDGVPLRRILSRDSIDLVLPGKHEEAPDPETLKKSWKHPAFLLVAAVVGLVVFANSPSLWGS